MKRLAFSIECDIQMDVIKFLDDKVDQIDAEYLRSLSAIENVSRLYDALENLFDHWGNLSDEN